MMMRIYEILNEFYGSSGYYSNTEAGYLVSVSQYSFSTVSSLCGFPPLLFNHLQ
jgi:hypothetical protein